MNYLRGCQKSKAEPKNTDLLQKLQIVAFASLFSISFGGSLGLSHVMGLSRFGVDKRLLPSGDISNPSWDNFMPL